MIIAGSRSSRPTPRSLKDFADPARARRSPTSPGASPDILGRVRAPADDLGGWRVTPAASAGEAQAAADAALTTGSGFFTATTDYKKLSAFEIGGKPTRSEYCPNEARTRTT